MLEISNLTKRFGNHLAVDNISFTVGEGEIVGFLGPNGAGKSTTMNMITGYLSSDTGSVKVDGLDLFEEPLAVKKKIGYLPEQPPLYADMTVREYLNFVYELKGCTLNRKKHLAEICQIVKITDDYQKNRLIRNLSKGYRQRIGIAQALIGNPSIIILDEPTVGLDPKEIIEIRRLIRALGETHTVILSTHILSEAQAVCNRILIINAGAIVADEKSGDLASLVSGSRRLSVRICGPQREVLRELRETDGVVRAEASGEREDDSYLYEVESAPGVDPRKPIFFMLAKNNWPLIGLEQQGASLEDIFISITEQRDTRKMPSKKDKQSYAIVTPDGETENYSIKEEND